MQHIPPEARIFPLLDSSHPSEKVPQLPVFYETPTHQPSNCSQHVLWFYVSNKKQLHLHKTCSFLSRLSPRGWSGVGGKLPFQQERSLGCPTLPMALPRHGDARKGHFPAVFSARMTPPQTCDLPAGRARARGHYSHMAPMHTPQTAPGCGRGHHSFNLTQRASCLCQTHTHAKQQIVSSQLLGQQHYFHTQDSRSFWI